VPQGKGKKKKKKKKKKNNNNTADLDWWGPLGGGEWTQDAVKPAVLL
jgi:hypothetical protein